MPAKIIIAGEGGQGVQTIAKILTKAAKKSGKNVSYLPSFGVEQRGGVSLAYIQVSSRPIPYPRFSKADFVVTLSSRSCETIKNFISDNSLVIYDSAEIYEKDINELKAEIKRFVAVPAKNIASETLSTKVANIIILGVLSAQLKDISFQDFQDTVLMELAAKIKIKPELKELNNSALQMGAEFAQNYESSDHLTGKSPDETVRSFENDKVKWTRFPEYCKGCSLCILSCPVKAITFAKDLNFLGTPMPIVDMEKCIGCGKCMQICPDGAINVEKK